MVRIYDRIPTLRQTAQTPRILANVRFDVEPKTRKGCPMQCIGECSCRPEPCKRECFCVRYCPKYGK